MRTIPTALLILSFITFATFAKDKPWKIDKTTLKQSIAKQFKNKKPSEKLTLAEYKNQKVFQTMKKAKRDMDLGLDLTTDYSELTQYGIDVKGNGEFKIDLNANPGWISITNLFTFMGTHLDPATTETLTNKGFRAKDLETLGNYLSSRDVHTQINDTALTITARFKPLIVANHSNGVDNHDTIYLYSQELYDTKEQLFRSYSLDMLNLFDQHRQRILVDYALGISRKRTIKVIESFEETVINVEQKFLSNEY
ncbi:MAG: hypothetical protein ACI8WB_002960 [Phenylobacterium sp.]|jgi:hypothetical protein